MEKSMLKRSQIPCIPSISLDHKNWCTTIRPISSFGGCGYGYGANYNFKRSSVNLHLHSVLKPSVFAAGKTNKRGLLWVHLIRATSFESYHSSSDKGEDDAPDQSKHYNAPYYSVFSVIAGIIGGLIRLSKGILGVVYREKKAFQRIEEKIENTVEVVEEVADTVKDVAKATEEIAEKIEKRSKDGSILHETAEIVDEISERVATDAQIVENEVEKIKEGIKTIDEKVGKTEDAVKEIAEIISGADDKEHDKGMDTAEKSSIPIVETDKDNQSVDSVSKSNFGEVCFKDLMRRLTWLLFWARELSPKILGMILVVIVVGTSLTGYSGHSHPMVLLTS